MIYWLHNKRKKKDHIMVAIIWTQNLLLIFFWNLTVYHPFYSSCTISREISEVISDILSCGDGERQAALKLSQPWLLYLWRDELDYGGAQWLHTTVVIRVVQRPHSTVHLHTKTHTISICTVSFRNVIFICTKKTPKIIRLTALRNSYCQWSIS